MARPVTEPANLPTPSARMDYRLAKALARSWRWAVQRAGMGWRVIATDAREGDGTPHGYMAPGATFSNPDTAHAVVDALRYVHLDGARRGRAEVVEAILTYVDSLRGGQARPSVAELTRIAADFGARHDLDATT